MTTDATMMNDIIEEPEKDTLLGMLPEPQVLSVMSAKASPANANVLVGSGSYRPQPSICIIGREINKSTVHRTGSDIIKFVYECIRFAKLAHERIDGMIFFLSN